ncbi:hypothetical protein GNI_198010, partial [Gregarina niphandrodes]
NFNSRSFTELERLNSTWTSSLDISSSAHRTSKFTQD